MSDFRTALTERLDEALGDADAALARHYPGPPTGRHPVHTVYLPADRCRADDVRSFAAAARELIAAYAPNAAELARATGEPEDDVAAVYDRIVAKLEQEPIEDLRADFEDGYGVRSDDAEDGHLADVLAGFRMRRHDHRLGPQGARLGHAHDRDRHRLRVRVVADTERAADGVTSAEEALVHDHLVRARRPMAGRQPEEQEPRTADRHGYASSNVTTRRAPLPAVIDANAAFTSSRRMRSVTRACRSRRPSTASVAISGMSRVPSVWP